MGPVIEEWERKAHARARRRRALEDGFDTRTRWVPAGTEYKRKLKHVPRDAADWEEVDG